MNSSLPLQSARNGPALRARVESARATAAAALLRERNAGGWWTGELSPSALSTATAMTALAMVAQRAPAIAVRLHELVRRAQRWLITHQNADGGWGDTPESVSNISTTTLVWSALRASPEAAAESRTALPAAERWLTAAAGSLEPAQLVRAIEQRYGADRTFSIPILTQCALCGALGPEDAAWAHVRQLPFELAVLPQRWFGALQLPVVSYALPALIAIGQVRHGRRPTRNPVWRALRDGCGKSTLAKLERLQPVNGGFLEATPLTSFVTMSLAALDLTGHPVVQRGVAFLEASVRPDGSWPIDTNLATWVTTLAVNALGSLDVNESESIRRWLVTQQYRHVHPYTLAAPGGWAWTDLPGGVPDGDDTAGALVALHLLGGDDPSLRDVAQAGVEWLLALQNRDGGIPTFCRGWGKLPFDRSSPDLTAHAIRAWLAWSERLPPATQRRLRGALGRAARFLQKTQRPDGAWLPLWFGHQADSAGENSVYGTGRVIPALCLLEATVMSEISSVLDRAVRWLCAAQHADGGWSGAATAASSMEETGVALEALAAAWERTPGDPAIRPVLQAALERGAAWLVQAIEAQRWHEPRPIGLYFAKLWYHERLYPLIFATGALTRTAKLKF